MRELAALVKLQEVNRHYFNRSAQIHKSRNPAVQGHFAQEKTGLEMKARDLQKDSFTKRWKCLHSMISLTGLGPRKSPVQPLPSADEETKVLGGLIPGMGQMD